MSGQTGLVFFMVVTALQITADGLTNLREGTDRSPEEVPGPSQATRCTACRASERSERRVTTGVSGSGPEPMVPT